MPVIQEFLSIRFTPRMEESVSAAIWSTAATEHKLPPTRLYAKSTHPFASFYPIQPSIQTQMTEMGVTSSRDFATLENLFQYYKARIAGKLRVALTIVGTTPARAKERTSESKMTLPDLPACDHDPQRRIKPGQ